jgi:glutaredoxin-related protein
MKSFKVLTVVFAVLLATVSTSSLAIAAKNRQQVNSAKSNSKTVRKVAKAKKKVVQKPAKKYPLIIVFGRDACGRTVRMKEELARHNIRYKYSDVDNPAMNQQMWDLLSRYEFDPNDLGLPVVYVKGYVFLDPSIEDVKSQI